MWLMDKLHICSFAYPVASVCRRDCSESTWKTLSSLVLSVIRRDSALCVPVPVWGLVSGGQRWSHPLLLASPHLPMSQMARGPGHRAHSTLAASHDKIWHNPLYIGSGSWNKIVLTIDQLVISGILIWQIYLEMLQCSDENFTNK